jgi:hypothetical protein
VKVINAIYNFIVGDWIILSGIVLAVLVLALIHYAIPALSPFSGFILIVASLLVLIVTLSREAYSQHRH